MLFEHMTSLDLKEASERGLIAILPIGSIEAHGPHMPLGTDSISAFEIAKRAAEKEEAIVLPPLYYAYVLENRHFPGTISLTAKTLLDLLEEICDEVARNGFKKILIVNGHGGNASLLRVFLRECQAKKKDYVVYAIIAPWEIFDDLASRLSEGRKYGHACEIETSIGLFLFGDHIKMDNVKREARLGKTGLPRGIETAFDWQAYAVDLYVGDPRYATREKGELLVERMVEILVDAIRAIKKDTEVPRLLNEYFQKTSHQCSH
ncbi:MAG: creatininase family protein [Candidatus Bathyarchaeota archaeon]|nr:creatininase family protein [Candidatus Bathyarchaeota archaeon]